MQQFKGSLITLLVAVTALLALVAMAWVFYSAALSRGGSP